LTTLWSHIPLGTAFITERSVSDFHRIIYKGSPLTSNIFNEEHQKALDFLKTVCLRSASSKIVIVSLHVPTSLCMAEEFKGSSINGAFVAELHDFIYDNQINYWIYGHSHRNMPVIDIYWMDFGNAQTTGQVIMGTVQKKIPQPKSNKYKTVESLKVITEYVKYSAVKVEESGPSCSLAEALQKQDLYINSTLAQLGCNILWKMFRQGMIEHQGLYMNLDTMKVNPIGV
jgi:hypothetical protein